MSRRDSRPEFRDRDDRRFNGGARDRDRRDIRDSRDGRDRRDNRDLLPKREPIKVDREKVCPTLVRVFTRDDKSHSVDDFKDGKLPSSDQEIQIHTWQDASLRELTQLIQSVREKARNDGARLVFNLVTVDRSGVSARDDDKTLYELGFEPGDYIDVAIQAR